MHKSFFFQIQCYIFPLNGCVYSTVSILFSVIQPDQNIWDNLQQVLGIHGSFEEFSLGDDNVVTSEHVADGDILQNVLKELEPEQDNDDDPNDDPDYPAEQDPDYIPSMGQLLHVVNHQKAFL